jgi:hypothetical protein
MISRRTAIQRTRIKRSTKPIPKVNPRRQAKRKAGYRKMLASPEYKSARAEALERAGDKCEEIMHPEFYGQRTTAWRCGEVKGLHAHHLRYPKTRPLASSDLKILCKWHHEQAESLKPHKTRMF